jgi:hypothetical protein
MFQMNTEAATVLLTAIDQSIASHSVAAVGALRADCVEGVLEATALTAAFTGVVQGLPFASATLRSSLFPHQLVNESE